MVPELKPLPPTSVKKDDATAQHGEPVAKSVRVSEGIKAVGPAVNSRVPAVARRVTSRLQQQSEASQR